MMNSRSAQRTSRRASHKDFKAKSVATRSRAVANKYVVSEGDVERHFATNSKADVLLTKPQEQGKRLNLCLKDLRLGQDDGEPNPIHYGLELTLLTHSKAIKTKADLLTVWFHWCMLKNGFLNYGTEFSDNLCASENLPANLGWNGDKCAYILRYFKIGLPFAVSLNLTGKCSQVAVTVCTLHATLRVCITIDDVIDQDFQLREDMISSMTMLIDQTLLQPLTDFPDAENK